MQDKVLFGFLDLSFLTSGCTDSERTVNQVQTARCMSCNERREEGDEMTWIKKEYPRQFQNY